MIPKIILGKGDTRRLIAYLFGKGTANEHVDPHLVASWNGCAPDPGRSPHRDPKEVAKQLHTQLDQPVAMLGRRAPKTTVWHCPVRAAPEDPILTDEQWAEIARRIVAAAGIAPTGDKEACRWVAVRHADDHIHIAATLVRRDGRRPRRDHDIRAVQKEARQIEIDYGLRRLKPGDGTAAQEFPHVFARGIPVDHEADVFVPAAPNHLRPKFRTPPHRRPGAGGQRVLSRTVGLVVGRGWA